ncbi:hypothetical protein LTR84_010408 [Exophiala bonariae]|uniref:Uncharacterized protein n=1 Tax=Exophiala bonariae TaxID=1690606 RepID=A0AAV9MTV9_9EURO|nr:hypothetical protein LTR84_010408 [Exophiala bonariae]
MSRHKENNPLSTKQRPSIASMIKNTPSDDFFTDSIVENSSIPSPSPKKGVSVKPRRAVGITRALQTARELNQRSNRPSRPENDGSTPKTHLQPALSVSKKKSRSPLRSNDLSTPPRSKSLTLPPEFSSPPAGMTDVYQRIADEEDLVATEREAGSDEDDNELENGPQDSFDEDIDMLVDKSPPVVIHPQGQLPSQEAKSATPSEDDMKENENFDTPDNLSEAATLDFINNEMTDRVLAAKLTPHVVDRAKDRARLEKLRQSRIPIDFKNSPKLVEKNLNGQAYQRNTIGNLSRGPLTFDNHVETGRDGLKKTASESSASSTPQKRIAAFSRATRPNVTHDRVTVESHNDRFTDIGKRDRVIAFSRAKRSQDGLSGKDIFHANLPETGPKLVAFSRSERPARHTRAHSEEPEQTGEIFGADDTQTSILSEPLPGATPQSLIKKKQDTASFLAKWRQQAAERRSEKTESATSDDPIDWAAAGADIALPSVEQSSTPQDTPPRLDNPYSIQKQRSIDRIRKWENDFTGLSFQVSDSPPVRNRPNLNDSIREREIEDLAKQAVTTNRLGEIQEKDPNVLVRKTSRNFSSEERQHTRPEVDNEDSKVISHNGPGLDEAVTTNAPVSLHRSSSNSTTKSISSQRISQTSHDSLDHLQRLARAVSTTPRASPVPRESTFTTQPGSDKPVNTNSSQDDPGDQSTPQPRVNGTVRAVAQKIAETPKVIGAWTDTILPDTVKTVRQPGKASLIAETPHVNAGGWIDTPLATGKRLPPVPIPITIEEVTEDLTNFVASPHPVELESGQGPIIELGASNNISDRKELVDSPMDQVSAIPPSALANVLNKAKQKRSVTNDITDYREDTLNLGDATIQSFEDFLNNATDITADISGLIKDGAEEEFIRQRQKIHEGDAGTNDSEVVFIGHLTSRMERLMSNLHEARKGISRLEQKVSRSPPPNEQKAIVPTTSAVMDQSCAVCGHALSTQPHLHNYTDLESWLPMAYSVISVPIPLLFFPRRKGERGLLRRPTWLGWLTLAVWTWYLIECTMCELYARPLYAERYIWPTEPEPEFPLVLPTMILRWTRFEQFAPGIYRVLVAFYRMVGMILGFSDGFVDDINPRIIDEPTTTAVAPQVTKAAWNIVRNLLPGGGYGAEPDLSMMNDEII